MKTVIIVGGGAAGMLAGIAAAGMAAPSIFLRKMKSWGKRSLSRAKGAVM